MMTLILYKNKSDAKCVTKDIEQLAELECNVYGDCTILSPTMLLKYASYLAECNYAYIQEFGRYYFTGNPILMNGGRCILPMFVDVLMSHKDGINGIYCNISRCETEGITMIPDSNIGLTGYETNILDFSGSFTQSPFYSYVLGVLGGAYS